ncbi:MAG: transposase [Rhodospirillaceae bacterium]|nr:transposase [Rhodospirillaceae bacterium]
MPRIGRYFLPDQPVHVIQRGNNRQQTFFADDDNRIYLELLQDASDAHGLKIHAYVLMTNHVHLLVSPLTSDSLPKAMHDIGWHFTRHINATRGRTGSLWEGRYRASLIDTETYFFVCSRYIEMNPVRAGLALTPADYRWSSYRCNAGGAHDPLIWPHALYRDLGTDAAARAASYAALFANALTTAQLDEVRGAAHAGRALGSQDFIDRLERETGTRLRRRRSRRTTNYVPGT